MYIHTEKFRLSLPLPQQTEQVAKVYDFFFPINEFSEKLHLMNAYPDFLACQ